MTKMLVARADDERACLSLRNTSTIGIVDGSIIATIITNQVLV